MTNQTQSHKINQKLTCIGCNQDFHMACHFIEHLEFGYCVVISASQFHGHVIHKHLVTALLKDGSAYTRFQAKQAKYHAAHGDFDKQGGVCLDNPLDKDEEIKDVRFAALQPDTIQASPPPSARGDPYPPLPSQAMSLIDNVNEITSAINAMSVTDDDDSVTIVGSRPSAPPSACSDSTDAASTSTVRQLKVWGKRNGKTASGTLFPEAKPTPVKKEFSVAAHDEQMERDHGINILKTRFWDPQSPDWNPERFYDSIISKYNCPFVCERTFETSADLNTHISSEHRLIRMKCPSCLKYFDSTTALVAHCESRGSKCPINKANEYNIFLDKISGGFLGVNEKVRPDHLSNPHTMITDPITGRSDLYKPPVASYLQYTVTTPPDWKKPIKVAAQIGTVMPHSPW